MSNSSIMSIREMIDTAFGDSDVNIVNFKLMQTILYILARQLRLLERRVGIEITSHFVPSSSSLSVTEVKLATKKKKRLTKPGDGSTFTSKDKKKISLNKQSAEKRSEILSSKSTTERSTTDKTSSSPTTTTDKTTTEPSSSTKTSTLISSSDKTKSSTEKSSSDRTKSSTEKSTSDRTKSSTEKSSSDKTKTSTEKSSSEKTKSSTDKSSSLKESSYKSSSEEQRTKFPSQNYHQLLELIEQQREQELRIVNQRADSREEAKKTPTPMASLETMEMEYEKLLIVERVPVEEAVARTGRLQDSAGQIPQLSVVTQDQFDSLAQKVKELQEKFNPTGKPEFLENMKLMQELRKGASLTDAMAALQLSARLEATEKTLEQMMSLVTDLASRKGLDIETILQKKEKKPETEVIFGAKSRSAKDRPSKQPYTTKALGHTASEDILKTHISLTSQEEPIMDTLYGDDERGNMSDEQIKTKPDWIIGEDLREAIEEIRDNLLKTVTNVSTKAASTAEDASKLVRKIERKLESTAGLDTRMKNLETLVSNYAEQINILDTGLSSQMTNYQEQLTQMQHDLEAGLESMAEALANTGGDTAAVAELNGHFNDLQIEFDSTNVKQKDLKENQDLLALDLQALWAQIEILRGTKSDRDEVADALRDKAGLGALNGLVTQQQFDAVRGDFEKRIGAAYDKFNNQEIIWQKAIDDLLRELNEKADWAQVVSLRDDVNDNMQRLRNRINSMLEIVGEPKAAAISKKIFRDTACLSCSSPAHMDLEEPSLVPALPSFAKSSRPPTIGAEDSSKPKEDGDHAKCFPGYPIPHPRDPRSQFCQRYCGGSHTVANKINRSPVGMTIKPALRSETTEVGTDGKLYISDDPNKFMKPCFPCNIPNEIRLDEAVEMPSNKKAPSADEFDSSMTPMDLWPELSSARSMHEAADCISVTPPPPCDGN